MCLLVLTILRSQFYFSYHRIVDFAPYKFKKLKIRVPLWLNKNMLSTKNRKCICRLALSDVFHCFKKDTDTQCTHWILQIIKSVILLFCPFWQKIFWCCIESRQTTWRIWNVKGPLASTWVVSECLSESFTCCDLTVPQAHRDVINGYQATFPEVLAYADKHKLGNREKDCYSTIYPATIPVHSSLIHPSACVSIPPFRSFKNISLHIHHPSSASYLGKHGLHVGDLHLSPHSPGSVSQAPHLLLGHIILVINVQNQSIVYFPKPIKQVVEPQAVFVIPR